MSQAHDEDELQTPEQESTQNWEIRDDIIQDTSENIQSETQLDPSLQEISRLKELLARTQADYENFTKRTERDKADMVAFMRADILKKIVPRLDDLERMIVGTPEDLKTGVLYDGIIALQKVLQKDLEKMWVLSFISKGSTVNPELHEVMTQIPWEDGIILDEFEKGYMLWDKVLRVAKVVVGSGNL